MEIKLNIIDEKHYDSFWYDEEVVAQIIYDDNNYCNIIATGEKKAFVDNEEPLEDVATNDDELNELCHQGRVCWYENNWYELDYIIDGKCVDTDTLDMDLSNITNVDFLKDVKKTLDELRHRDEAYCRIIDLNGAEEDEICFNVEQFREFTENMLRDYFEVNSKYGDVVGDIFKYVENDKLVELVERYNYKVEMVEKN